MNFLQAVMAYWRDCIKSEGALEQNFGVNTSNFSLTARTRAVLFEGTKDPFIFADGGYDHIVTKSKAYDLVTKASVKGHDVYFGYPLLMFYDRIAKKNRVAPLFVIRLEVTLHDNDATLARAERLPTLGSNAFEKLGLKQEEVAALNGETQEIFDANKTSKLETILYLLQKETKLTFVEGIDPNNLSSSTTIYPYSGTVVYNKAVLFASEASVYNLHILNDLEKLATKSDMASSSLKYLDPTASTSQAHAEFTPVLPFEFDEYQMQAIKHILNSEHTVVTGPPGTGKSQFIANLVINLFLQKKRVLLVSHTGEAVRVVNERINTHFTNLMMQTGKKEIRQDLGRRLKAMVTQYNDRQISPTSSFTQQDIGQNWAKIHDETRYLAQTDAMHRRLEKTIQRQSAPDHRTDILSRLVDFILNFQIDRLTQKLEQRRGSHEVLSHIQLLKTRHVDISRSYVKASYLDLILGNDHYGELAAYIDAVQNKKSTHDTADRSASYIRAALQAMSVWSCTLKSLAATFPLQANLFDYVIFDEASQIDLPSAAPALYRAKRAVIVGDENQLNHIAKISPKLDEELSRKYDLTGHHSYPALISYIDASLFNSAKKALRQPEQELKNHYRSNTAIAGLFSSIFYNSKLKVHEPQSNLPKNIEPGVHWLHVKGEAYKHKAGSRYNRQEVAYALESLRRLLPIAREHGLTIGLTTPYSRQRDVIAEGIVKMFGADSLQNVKVLTVHQFQGSEVDILIFSTVLAEQGDGSSDYWYVKNKQILNVAVSRAKQLLVIIGDIDFALKSASKLKDIAEYCLRDKDNKQAVPNRPMNIFEKKLLDLLKELHPVGYKLEPQFVVANRFTVDFALLSKDKNIAIELDGRQHEIIGGLPVFEDMQRDMYLEREGWRVVRIGAHELQRPDLVTKRIDQALFAGD